MQERQLSVHSRRMVSYLPRPSIYKESFELDQPGHLCGFLTFIRCGVDEYRKYSVPCPKNYLHMKPNVYLNNSDYLRGLWMKYWWWVGLNWFVIVYL